MRTFTVVLLALLLGCSPDYRESRAPGASTTLVIITPEPDTLPFDPRSSRLRAATDELARTCGHYVAFQIDAALARETVGSFEHQLIEGIETLAKEFAELKRKDPAAFAYAAPLVEKVECKWRAVAPKARASLVVGSRILEVYPAAHGGDLVERGLAYWTFEEAYEAHLAERYARVSPRALSPAEQEAFFRFLDNTRSMNSDQRGDGVSEARGERILRMFALNEALAGQDSKLARDVHKWLFDHRSYLLDAYHHHPKVVQAAGRGSAFRRAEAAYVQWLQQQMRRFTEEQRLALANDVFVHNLGAPGYMHSAFPGFDKLGFALGIVDEWIRAGHPTQADRERRNALTEYIVCPHPPEPDGHRSLGPRCDYHLYRYAFETEADSQRLAEAMLQRGDAGFTEAVFVALPYALSGQDSLGKTLGLWRKVEGHEASWRIATRVIAEQALEIGDKARLSDEVRRQWRTRPEHRGLLLYVAASSDPYNNGTVAWKDFEQDYGEAVRASDFATFLEQGRGAWAQVGTLWPALGKGWSRSQVIVPRLDAYLADRYASTKSRVLSDIVRKLCAEGALADLAQLHGYLTDRVRRSPGESYTEATEASAPGACKPEAKTQPPRKAQPASKKRVGKKNDLRDPWNDAR